jgi:hypothetical protein
MTVTTYEPGATIYFPLRITSDGTTLADLGGGLPTCTVTRPDATVTTATVTKLSTGIYQGALTSTLAGRYRGVFTGSGANSGDLPRTFPVDVMPADPRFIIGLDDAKAALNTPAGARVNDDELRLYIAATTEIIEDIVGAVLSTTRTQTFDGGRNAILLSERATSITSVTVGGTTTTNYVANLSSGVVYAGATGVDWFTDGKQNVTVAYTTGSSSIDPNVILAAREEVSFLYQLGQQGGRPSLGGSVPDMSWTPSGFAVPKRVIELCAPSMARRMPGIA